jgi:hypothetical protein
VTDQVADVKQILAPLALEDVKTVRCLGLNYALHAKEASDESRQGPGKKIIIIINEEGL